MGKDAYYFSHDSNAKDDPKCSVLIEQLGLEGYGIYWVLVETLRDQPEYKYPLSLTPIIARKYNTTTEKVRIVITGYGLFQVDSEEFFSLSLCRRMERMERQVQQRIDAGKASGEKRKLLLAEGKKERPFNDRLTDAEQMKLNEMKESSCPRKFSDEQKALAILLLDLILENNPKFKQPDINSWADEIRLMVERDKREFAEIEMVIKWCQKDYFWKSNILSTSKLREKFDQLCAKMGRITQPKLNPEPAEYKVKGQNPFFD